MHISRVRENKMSDVARCQSNALHVFKKILWQCKTHKHDTDDKIDNVDTCIIGSYTCTEKTSMEADGHMESAGKLN